MEFKGGVLIIGSLLWDLEDKPLRKAWQENLSMTDIKAVNLPIRYGRKSSSRSDTYSMVFSNALIKINSLGTGYSVPFKFPVHLGEQFENQVSDLARAEGFDPFNHSLIFKSWGTVCIIINPNISEDRIGAINQAWNNLVATKYNSLVKGQLKPIFDEFGEKSELKSIDDKLKLTVNLDDQFRNELSQFDFMLATSNSILRRDGKRIYPTAKEIALAMYKAKDFGYFCNNRRFLISTFQDKLIAKILRRKYKISLKSLRKKLSI